MSEYNISTARAAHSNKALIDRIQADDLSYGHQAWVTNNALSHWFLAS